MVITIPSISKQKKIPPISWGNHLTELKLWVQFIVDALDIIFSSMMKQYLKGNSGCVIVVIEFTSD